MLTADLVRARVRGPELVPSLVDPRDPRVLARAEALLAVFRGGTGATRGEIASACREVEGTETDHLLLRGLTKVLLDGCAFDESAPVEPLALRSALFRRAARTGPLARAAGPTGRRTAADVRAEIGADFGIDAEAVARALYADLPDERRLVSREGPDEAAALLHRYNLALVQAVLLRASEMRVHLTAPDPKRVRQLFRYLKFFELMFRVERSGQDDVLVRIDGPQSLLRQSTRYGMQLAKFLPAVALQPGRWKVEAELHWGRRGLRKRLALSDETGLRSHYSDRGAWRPRLEEWFEARFAEVASDWTLEPGHLVDLGGQSVLVPDFTLRRGDRVAHLDIVGFWRRGYLEKRVHDTPANVILAVSRRLAGEAAALPEAVRELVIEFKEVIPVGEVLARAERVATPPPARTRAPPTHPWSSRRE